MKGIVPVDILNCQRFRCGILRVFNKYGMQLDMFQRNATSTSTGSKVHETFRLLERVKKHFKGFYKKCAKKKPKKYYPKIL